MNYRTLGKTGLKVSEIGYGTWQLANDPNCWVGADLKESLRSLHKFAQLGGNFIAEKLLPYAKEKNIGLIARVPLDEGGLSGQFMEDTQFEEGDFRSQYFRRDRLKELVIRIEKLKSLLDDEAETIPELGLRYILSFDEVSSVIPGMRKVKHVEANVSVSGGRTSSAKLMEQLKNHAWERNFYPYTDPSMKAVGYMEL